MALRVVKPGEDGAPAEKLTVAQAAATGDRLKLLVAMQERISTTVTDEKCPPRDLAALTRRLQDISEEIEALKLKAKQEAMRDGDSRPAEAWDAAAI